MNTHPNADSDYEIISIIENNSDIMRIIQRKRHELSPCDRKESFLLDVILVMA
jgi:hypothetical protein